MKLTNHNTEQAARGYLMYELARRGYVVQFTDSRFPTEDLLVLSPGGKHFGIDVKGQRTRSYWLFKERSPSKEHFYAFVYVPEHEQARVFIMNSATAMKLRSENRERILERSGAEDRRDELWGLNWTIPHKYEDRYDILPK